MNFQKFLHRRIAAVSAFFFFCFLALGFLSVSHPVDGVKKTLPVAQTAGSDTAKFVMCELITDADVAGYSPFKGGFTKSETWPATHIPQGCSYTFNDAEKNDPGIISILLNDDFTTNKDAMSSLKNWEKMIRDQELDFESVDSLGNMASTSGDDEVGLNVVIGNRLLTINLNGQFPDITSSQKKKAAIALARFVMNKLKLK